MKLFVLFICIGLLTSCVAKKEVKIITQKYGMPETRTIENIDGKGLNEFAALEVKAEVFFETEFSIRSSILTDNDRLYFGNEKCEFYAIDINTKQELWKYLTDIPVQTKPVIIEEKIIFNAGNSLYILNAVYGNEIYKITFPSNNSSRVSFNNYVFNDSYTAVCGNIAYFAALDGTIVAVNINNGEIDWTLPSGIQFRGEVASGINLYNNKLYFVDYFGFLNCVDTETIQTVFKTGLQDRIFAPILIDNNKIYIGSRNKKFYCIDANTGEFIWSTFSYDPTTWFTGGSVIIGNVVYTGTSDERSIVAFNKNTGEFLHFYPAQLNVFTPPVLNGENIVVATVNVYSKKLSSIMEFDTRNNIKLWQANLDDCILSPPVIYQGVLYFGSDSGKIYSIDLN